MLSIPHNSFPSGYTKVQYIASDTDTNNSGQYIITGVIPNNGIKVECGFEFLVTNPYQTLFGVKSNRFGFGNTNSSTNFRAYVEGTGHDYNTQGIVNYFDIVMDMGGFDLNGHIESWTPPTSTANSALWLFGKSTSSGALDVKSKCRIYYCKIYDNNNILRDYIPCVRDSDNVAGLYDMVTKEFYINNGNGYFVAGPTA